MIFVILVGLTVMATVEFFARCHEERATWTTEQSLR